MYSLCLGITVLRLARRPACPQFYCGNSNAAFINATLFYKSVFFYKPTLNNKLSAKANRKAKLNAFQYDRIEVAVVVVAWVMRV